jgi:predicted transcriptional regulator
VSKDEEILRACSNGPKTVDEIAALVGRSWGAILGDINRLAREGRLIRSKRWGKASLWHSVENPLDPPCPGT